MKTAVVQEPAQIKKDVFLLFPQIRCLQSKYFEKVRKRVSSRTQVRQKILVNSLYLPDDLSVSYCYALI